MRKLFLIMIIISIVTIPALTQSGGTATTDYINALQKKSPGEKITAFEGYIKKYPATTNRYTKLAYYWLAINYFDSKKLSQAIKNGLKSEKLGGIEQDMKAKLLYVLSRSYASKGSLFNKDKAISYAKKTIKIAKAKNILAQAKKIKKKLSTPPKPSETPSQKIKRLYSDEDFDGVISTYAKLTGANKTDKTLHLIYTNSLFKKPSYAKAIVELKKIYATEKKGKHAKKIADCNQELSKSSRSKRATYLKEAVKYYIESSILYGREINKSNSKNAHLLSKNMIYQKYGLQRKIAAYNKKIKSQGNSATKNKAAIKTANREVMKFKRYLRREYRDMAPPAYELKKKKKLEDKLKNLKSGGGAKTNSGGAALNAEMKKANAELNSLIQQAKARL